MKLTLPKLESTELANSFNIKKGSFMPSKIAQATLDLYLYFNIYIKVDEVSWRKLYKIDKREEKIHQN